MPSEPLNRRRFLVTAGKIGLVGALVPMGISLNGCGGGKDEQATAGADKAAASAGCDDLGGLNASQKEVRQSYEYVETAADPAEACHLCAFWEAPEPGQTCGGCALFAGPVHPDGSCNSWEAV